VVVVASVVVALVMRASERVDEAVETKPFRKARVVEVEFSPVPSVRNGKAKVRAAGKEVRQSPEIQRMVVEAYWEEKSVEVALVKVWSAVQLLALPTFSTMFLAVEPLYVPEKVRLLLPAVRSPRF